MYLAEQIEVRDSAIDPTVVWSPKAPRKIAYRKVNDREFFKVWIYLDGPGVPFVDEVIYELHPSFAKPVHRVPRTPANPTCALIIWTWGVFDVHAKIRDKKGQLFDATHALTYDRDFKDANLIEWVLEDESSALAASRAVKSQPPRKN